MFIEALVFIVGLFLLVKGSDFFVQAASNIAKRLGVQEFIIGLTIVAIGTSIPELSSSIAAAIKGSTGLIIGNVVGSNIANIGLIIGVMGLAASIKTHRKMLVRDGYIMMFATALAFLFMFSGSINAVEAGVLLLVYILYLLFLLEEDKGDDKREYDFAEFFEFFLKAQYIDTIKKHATGKGFSIRAHPKQFLHDGAIMGLSLIAIILGARYVVEEAQFFATLLGVPEAVIGITLIAVGTSLPELSVTVSAARKGMGQIAIGNVVGSNVANILLVLGVSGLFTTLNISQNVISYSMPILLVMSALLLVFIRSGWKLRKWESVCFLVLYGLFIAAVVLFPTIIA